MSLLDAPKAKIRLSTLLSSSFILLNVLRNYRLHPSEIKRTQEKKLRKIVKHSYDNVWYYHFLFKKAHIFPEDIKTTDDLQKIPISEKNDIKRLPLEKTTATNFNLNDCWVWPTSGTSGTPTTVYWEKKAKLMQYIENYFLQMNCGNKITYRQVVLGADWIPITLIQKLGIFKTKDISPTDKLENQIRQIQEFDPQVITAYPSCVRIVAKEIADRDLHNIRIPLVFTGGESFDSCTRELIESTLGSEVFDAYGANEVGGVSMECIRHSGYHIWGDSVIVEILRDGEKASIAEEGEITVTNLTNYSMPFIRYNLHDMGKLLGDKCSCGNPFPLMAISDGRESEIIHLCNGRSVSALAACGFLTWLRGIKQFQVTQERYDKFTVRIMKENGFSDRTIEEVKQALRSRLGEVEIDAVVVDDIPRERTGKLQAFVSKIHA